MGTAESVENLSAQTIRLWQRMVFQPNNACICVAGPVTKGMEATAIAYFSDLANYTGQPPFVQTAPQNFCMRDESSDDVSEQ